MLHKIGETILGDLAILDVLSGEGDSAESEVYLVQSAAQTRRKVAKTRQVRHGTGWGPFNEIYGEGLIRQIASHISTLPKLDSVYVCHRTGRTFLVEEFIDGDNLENTVYARNYSFNDVVGWWFDISKTLCELSKLELYATDLHIGNFVARRGNRELILVDSAGLRMRGLGPSDGMDRKLIMPGVTWHFGRGAFQFGFIVQHLWNRTLVKYACEPVRTQNIAYQEALSGWHEMVAKADALWLATEHFLTLDGPAMTANMIAVEDRVIALLRLLFSYQDEFQEPDYSEIFDLISEIKKDMTFEE